MSVAADGSEGNFGSVSPTIGAARANIIGGPFPGGNFFAKPDGTGFSQTCPDADADGLCDAPFVIAAGNVDHLPLKDITPPEITLPGGDITVEADGSSGTPVTSADIATFLSGASAEDAVDGPVSVSHDAPGVLPLGTTTITFTATDSSGNTVMVSVDVTIVDTTAPVLTLPASITVAAEGPTGTPATQAQIAAFLAGASAEDSSGWTSAGQPRRSDLPSGRDAGNLQCH